MFQYICAVKIYYQAHNNNASFSAWVTVNDGKNKKLRKNSSFHQIFLKSMRIYDFFYYGLRGDNLSWDELRVFVMTEYW